MHSMDTDRADRAKRAKELNSIFASVMDEGHHLVGAERAAVFMIDEGSGELWSRVATEDEGKAADSVGIIKCPLGEGLVGRCVRERAPVNIADAYQEPDFDRSVDNRTGFKTKSVLVVPIWSKSDDSEEGKVIGAVEMLNKKSEDGDTIVPFTSTDEKIVEMLASHVASFIRVVDSS